MVKRDRRATIIDDGSLPVMQEYINKGKLSLGVNYSKFTEGPFKGEFNG